MLLIIIVSLYRKNTNLIKDIRTLSNKDSVEDQSFTSKIIHPFIELYDRNNFILYFIFSLFLYVIASIPWPDITIVNNFVLESHTIQNILISAATVVLSSGVFSSITKSKHFLNIFSNEMKTIIYTEQFLSKQKNVDQIWNVVTKSICNENFHKISDKLFNKIKENYLPINHTYYYENYNLELHIAHECLSGTDYVIIREVSKVDIICDDRELTHYRSASNIEYLHDEESQTYFKLLEFTVNGEDVKDRVISNNTKRDGKLSARIEFPLKGEMKYSIYKVEEKKYSLKLNANRVHSAIKIYHNFELVVYHPDLIKVRFNRLGQDNNWSPVETLEIGGGMSYLKTSYDGVFFQNQGYMLNLFVI